MRVLQLLDDGDVIELDVEVLVDALEGAAKLDVVLELDGDLVVDERLEEAGGSLSASCRRCVAVPATVEKPRCKGLVLTYLKKSIVGRWACREGVLGERRYTWG